MLSFTVHGDPVPQGSKKAFPVYKGSGAARQFVRVNVVEQQDERIKTWREAVKSAALDAMRGSDTYPLEGPLVVGMVFSFRRPKSHFRTGKNATLLRDAAPDYPAGQPDLSKLVRSTEDAMTDAGAFRDDAQIVACRPLLKVYVGHTASLGFPGAHITVRRMRAERVSDLAWEPRASGM